MLQILYFLLISGMTFGLVLLIDYLYTMFRSDVRPYGIYTDFKILYHLVKPFHAYNDEQFYRPYKTFIETDQQIEKGMQLFEKYNGSIQFVKHSGDSSMSIEQIIKQYADDTMFPVFIFTKNISYFIVIQDILQPPTDRQIPRWLPCILTSKIGENELAFNQQIQHVANKIQIIGLVRKSFLYYIIEQKLNPGSQYMRTQNAEEMLHVQQIYSIMLSKCHNLNAQYRKYVDLMQHEIPRVKQFQQMTNYLGYSILKNNLYQKENYDVELEKVYDTLSLYIQNRTAFPDYFNFLKKQLFEFLDKHDFIKKKIENIEGEQIVKQWVVGTLINDPIPVYDKSRQISVNIDFEFIKSFIITAIQQNKEMDNFKLIIRYHDRGNVEIVFYCVNSMNIIAETYRNYFQQFRSLLSIQLFFFDINEMNL